MPQRKDRSPAVTWTYRVDPQRKLEELGEKGLGHPLPGGRGSESCCRRKGAILSASVGKRFSA